MNEFTEAAKAAEQTVIGAILIAPEEALPKAAGLLREEDFGLAPCRNIYAICKERFLAQKPVDLITVYNELGGGPEYREYLTQLAQIVPSLRNVDEYIGIVRQNARRVKAEEEVARLQADLAAGAALDACQEAASALLQTLSDTQDCACYSADELYYRLYSRIEQPKEYIPSGFSEVDRYIAIDRGDYVVIGGRPSAGKTAFSLQMAVAMARQRRVVYFSLETGADALMDRMASFYTGTPFSDLIRHTVRDFKPLAAGYDRFSRLGLHVVEAAGWTVERIKAKAVQLQADVVFIDYLQLIAAEGKGRVEKVTNISIGLHTMAQQGKISVVALSQLSREGDSDPDMTSLRESGQVEQDADVVLLLKNGAPKKQSGERELIIAKNKKGGTGKLTLDFAGNLQRFTQREERYV